jgi:3',5'-cyclic AMP phosphodiesterase CpdA
MAYAAEMVTLAHISDIHLAPLPPVQWTELMNKRITGYINWRLRRRSSLSGDGLHNLVQHMKEQQPDFVAVTGDLVNLGLEAEANTAWNWLQTVGDEHAVCVSPGTHDAYVKPAFGFNAERWGGYMRGETMDVAQFPFVRRVDDVAVISCSSSVPSGPFMAIGRFEQDQADRLARILKLMGEAGYFRVVLIHHPPNQEARSLRLGLRGAKRFREVVAEHGAELVLHGHTHKSTIFAIPGRTGDVPVIGVAAAGAAQREDGGEDPARYNLFKIERLGTAWSCSMREFGFQRLSPDIVLRLSLRIY